MTATGPWLILYDEDCGLCQWLLAAVIRWDRVARLRPVALQGDEAARLLAELSEDERMRSWHLISPTGERHSAGAAFPPLLELLPGGAPAAWLLGRAPGPTARAYRWVADHRSPLSRLVPGGAKRRAREGVRRREQRFQ